MCTFIQARFDDVREVVRLAGGQWSRAFRFEAGTGKYVVRFGKHREDYEKDALAHQWLSSALPVPEACEIGDAFDGFYAISTWVDGRTVDTLAESELRAALPALLSTIDATGRVEPPGTRFGLWHPRTGDGSHRTWPDFLAAAADRDDERIHGWRRHLDAVPAARKVFAEAAGELAARAPACGDVPRRLIHADLLAGNVFVVEGHVTGVIDWGNALAGDPMYDAAWLMFWSPWHPGIDRERVLAFALQRWDSPNFAERLRCCELHIGLDAMQYNAFTQRFDDLDEVTPQVERLLTAGT